MQKTVRKKHQILASETILKISHLAKAITHANAMVFFQTVSLGQKLKMAKTCEKPFYNNIRVVLCKKSLKKTLNIERKGKILKIGHLAKALAQWEEPTVYSLCKMVRLGQKLKMG